MCVIAVAIKSELPLSVLRACERANRDGGGCSWVENGLVHFRKGVTPEQIAGILAGKPLPHVVHFRIGTVGSKCAAKCHPFVMRTHQNDPAEGAAKAVLYHNGHYNRWELDAKLAGVQVPKDASDSQVVAMIAAFRGESLLTDYVHAGAGKFAVMHNNGEVKLYGRFEERQGAMFSNLHWAFGMSCNPLHHEPQSERRYKTHGSHGGNGGGHKSSGPKNHKAYVPWWQNELALAADDTPESIALELQVERHLRKQNGTIHHTED